MLADLASSTGSLISTVMPCSAQIRAMFSLAQRRESSRVNGMGESVGRGRGGGKTLLALHDANVGKKISPTSPGKARWGPGGREPSRLALPVTSGSRQRWKRFGCVKAECGVHIRGCPG